MPSRATIIAAFHEGRSVSSFRRLFDERIETTQSPAPAEVADGGHIHASRFENAGDLFSSPNHRIGIGH